MICNLVAVIFAFSFILLSSIMQQKKCLSASGKLSWYFGTCLRNDTVENFARIAEVDIHASVKTKISNAAHQGRTAFYTWMSGATQSSSTNVVLSQAKLIWQKQY